MLHRYYDSWPVPAARVSALLVTVLLFSGCQWAATGADRAPDIREITVLYTNDEHGWMEGMEPALGAAGLYRLWQEREDYRPDGPFLILSGGDNWTGPAISTWVEGESMVEVMNAMHYDASAVGNHEFDFGLEALQQRLQEADFPYLSANTLWRETGQVAAELGILPYTLKEVNGLRIGIIGLTTTSTPRTTNPQNMIRLQFGDYEQALRATVPQVRQAEPDLLFVIAHVCMAALEPLAIQVEDLGIHLMGGGHCNELTARRVNSTVLLGGGYHFTAYARARISFDVTAGRVVDVQSGISSNEPLGEDPQIDSIVSRWQDQFRGTLEEVVAWSSQDIDFRNGAFRQAVIDSWLRWDPSADIAITNAGGLRTSLPAGAITFNDLVNFMPFENNIFAVEIPGRVVRQALESGGRPIVAGLVRRGDGWILTASGEPLQDDTFYRVLLNSFMYDGGDNFQMIRAADPEGFDTGIHYRQPFVERLVELQTSPQNPLVIGDLMDSVVP
jgi:2',3'-cyclic-nucleotide 2'-phosphodiesterase (5'-nucleotidase family)